jgi:AcrR family transcriptional regulator
MPRPPKITNEEILAAARQVFLDEGIGASTLTIAEKAGISEASIFKRFATKQALFMAAMGISERAPWVTELPHRQPTAAIKAELTQLCGEMMVFYQEVLPRVMMVMVQSKRQFPPMVPSPPPPVRDAQLLADFLERAIAQNYIKAENPEIIAQMIVGAIVNYVTMTTVASKVPFPAAFLSAAVVEPELFVKQLIETLWMGIAPD